MDKFKIIFGDATYEEDICGLIKAFAEKTGYLLDAALDTESDAQKYEILIGDTNRPESSTVDGLDALTYILKAVDEKIVIKAGGRHSYRKLFTELADIIARDAEAISTCSAYELRGDFFDDTAKTSIADGADIRLMSANLMAERRGWAPEAMELGFEFSRRAEIFLSALEFYKPTVVGVQECCIKWREAIRNYRDYKEKWELLEYINPVLPDDPDNKVYSSVLFRKDLYDLVDSGMQYYSEYTNIRAQCITWAMLKDKKSGQQFCFISTHTHNANGDVATVQANELIEVINSKSTPSCPVFSVGDFNKSELSEPFKRLLAETGSVDCMNAAKVRTNFKTSGHDWAKNGMWSISLDHITATSDTAEVLQFETLAQNEQIWASDHSWLIADIKFK